MLTNDIISFEQLGRVVPGVDPGRFLRGFDLINLPYLLYLFEKTSLGKQCKFRSDATKCGIWSGSILFTTYPAILHGLVEEKYKVKSISVEQGK